MNNRPVADYEELIPWANRSALKCQEALGAFYTPGIHIHPAFVQMSCDEIDKACAQNVRLIGEIVPYMMGWQECVSTAMIEILEYASYRNMVVNIHPTNIRDMTALAKALPHLQIVYAHLNGCDEQLDLMKRFDHVAFDFSAHSSDYEGMLRHTIDCVGSDRLLYGSDYPGYSPVLDLVSVMTERLSDSEREAILFRNARRLLDIE